MHRSAREGITCSEHGSRGSSPQHSSRGRSLDLDLRNAPCYHAAIMRLLPYSMRRGLTLQHPVHAPPSPPASCFQPRPRSHPHHSVKHRRNRWLKPAPPNAQPSFIPPPLLTPPAPSHNASLLDHSFKSGAVYLEVKLAELQSRHKRHGPEISCTGAAGADVHRFGVCWQLLGELSRMKTPFGQALSTIYRELDKSIHSSYVAAKSSSISSTFQLVPYFELVAKLGARKLEIAVEREHLEANIRSCQSQIGHVEQDVQVSQKKLKLDENAGREVERSLSALLQDLEATLVQVRTLQEDILQFKRKMQKAKANQIKAHEVQYEQMMRHERRAKLEENYTCMSQDLQDAQAEIDIARRQACDSVPKEDLGVARAKVDELQKTLAELQAKANTQIMTSGKLTPRPLWEELLPLEGPQNNSTAELLNDICKHNVSLTFHISQLHQRCATSQASIVKKHGATQGSKDDLEQHAISKIQQPKIDEKKPQDSKPRSKQKT